MRLLAMRGEQADARRHLTQRGDHRRRRRHLPSSVLDEPRRHRLEARRVVKRDSYLSAQCRNYTFLRRSP
jgi:hypothetical protein